VTDGSGDRADRAGFDASGIPGAGVHRAGVHRAGVHRARSRRHDPGPAGLGLPAILAVAARPRLWPSLVRLMPPGWWRRWPPSPFPPREYVHFRTQTMYGDNGRLDLRDLIAYLEWCRRMGSRPR
jgi:hypothetical protein